MIQKLQDKLENLVFSVPHPHLSLDARLKPFADLLQAAYDAGRASERARCLAALDGLYHGDACRAALRSLD